MSVSTDGRLQDLDRSPVASAPLQAVPIVDLGLPRCDVIAALD